MSHSCRVVSLLALAVLLAGCRDRAADRPADNNPPKFEGTIPKSGAATVSLQMELV